MQNSIVIENIEAIRLQEGIDDVELRMAIRELKVGDVVNITCLIGPGSFEKLWIRITRIQGLEFRGKLALKPSASQLSELPVGFALMFRAVHIHSIPKQKPVRE
jgi:hypothetical protein